MKKRLIFDNIIFSLQKKGGISRYWSELLIRAFADKNMASIGVLEYYGNLENICRKQLVLPKNVILENIRKIPIFIERFLPIFISGNAIFHSSYFRYGIGKDVKNIITVYDCIYERYPNSISRKIALVLRRYALRHAKAVICISNNTRRDLLGYYPFLSVNDVHVVYLGVGPEFYQIENKEDSIVFNNVSLHRNSYLLYVGNRNNYKNLTVLLVALAKLKSKGLEIPKLLLIGGEPELCGEHQSIIKENNLENNIIWFKKCENTILNVCYNFARAYVCTSDYEGFGLTIIEAFRAGCPVICANNSSLVEVAGGNALMFDSNNVQQLADCIDKLNKNDSLEILVQGGLERSKQFSWDKTYEETKNIYDQLNKI